MKYIGNKQGNEPTGSPNNIKGNEMNTIEVKLRIKRDSEWNEWRVEWIQDGIYDEDKTYFTDDKQDAIDTKKAIIDSYSKTNYTNIIFVN